MKKGIKRKITEKKTKKSNGPQKDEYQILLFSCHDN